MKRGSGFLPALRFRRLTPLYDPVLRWVMRENTFKCRLIEEARLGPGTRVLDLGCGTGTLTILAKQMYPEAEFVGIDPDPEVLSRAGAKAERSGLHITWDQGEAARLPYGDGAFDRVVSSLVTHHMTPPYRLAAFRELRRVLRSGGEFHLLDFGPPRTVPMRILASILRPLEQAADHFDGFLPAQIREAGFISVAETGCFNTALGPLVMLRAVRPASPRPEGPSEPTSLARPAGEAERQ